MKWKFIGTSEGLLTLCCRWSSILLFYFSTRSRSKQCLDSTRQIFVTPALICWSENDTVISSLYLCFHKSRIYMTLVLMCWSENDILTYSLYWCFPNMQISVTLALMYCIENDILCFNWLRTLAKLSEVIKWHHSYTHVYVFHTAMISCILNFKLTWLHACAFK